MEAYYIMTIIGLTILGVVSFVELLGRGRKIKALKEQVAVQKISIMNRDKALKKEMKKKPVEWWSPFQTREVIMKQKGWSKSQFQTMLWALKKEGYAVTKGKGRGTRYSLRGKDL
jgi:hypothetical protein